MTIIHNEFDIEEDLDEVVPAKKDSNELNEVMDNYKRILSGVINVTDEIPSPVKKVEAVRQ